MDYSLLLIIAKYDEKVKERLEQSNTCPFVFFTKNKNFIIALGLIDYL